MKRTKHFENRMMSRGISETEVTITHLFGVRIRDKVVLSGKTCRICRPPPEAVRRRDCLN